MYGFHSFYFYFFLFYFCYTIIVSAIYNKKRNNFFYICWLFLPLFLLAALRAESVGGDLRNYIPDFNKTSRAKNIQDIFSGYEPGYHILVKCISIISSENRFYLIITSSLSLAGPLFLIYKYSPNYLWSVWAFYLMGFYTNTFNIVRQSIAVSIFFFSVPFLLNKKIVSYYLLALFSVTMHFSAISLFFLYPIVHKSLSIKNVSIFFIIVISLYMIAGTSMLYNIISLLFAKHDPDFVLDNMSGSGWNLLILYLIFFVCLFFIYKKKSKNLNAFDGNVLKMLVVFQMFALSFQFFATLYSTVMRMGMFFYIPVIVTIPIVFHLIKVPIYKLYMIIIVICLFCFYFYRTYSFDEGTGSNSQAVIPYILLEE